MSEKIKNIFSPLAAIFLVMMSSGLFSSYITIEAKNFGWSEWTIGFLSSIYYLGMLCGSFKNAHFIIRIGHIRAFSSYAAILTIVILLNGILKNIVFWFVLRAISGYCLAGCYIVIESWLLNLATKETRGQYLSYYMISLYGGQSITQLLLEYEGNNSLEIYAFMAIFMSMSIVPLAITSTSNPHFDKHHSISILELLRISPIAALGCLFDGLVLGSIFSFIPYFLEVMDKNVKEVGQVMFITILGSMLLQYPFGKLSDKIDRRYAICLSCFILILSSVSILFYYNDNIVLLISAFFLGGAGCVVYPLSLSYICDTVSRKDIITSVTQAMLLIYGIGSIIGPIITSLFIDIFSIEGLFLYFAVIASIFLIFIIMQIYLDKNPKIRVRKSEFISTASTTPVLSELDPRSNE